ncbi:MAG: phosphoribosylglycinamide synthetase C domain-containing protein, partial [Planctomycetota bacterium]|nr:phosphoribosylglycinamide synthetase C domain-containing protein [Planctomycetota bacterium]
VLEACQDHKRLREGDEGPNTGGMGAFCPTAVVDDAMMARIERDVLVPTVDTLRREGITYRGVLYAGLMLTPGGPKVLEFNVRFGDPECQPLMMRFQGDLAEVLYRTATGSLADAEINWDPRVACCVVLASRGYPEKPETGKKITGIERAEALEDVMVFHAGTKMNAEGEVVTAGGRVLGVTALGDTLEEARERALAACDFIHFDGMQLRRDIGAGAAAAR